MSAPSAERAPGQPPSIRRELRALLRLTGPILITQLGAMLLTVVDTAVVGRVGEVALGAVGLGGTVFFTVSVLGFGWMLALDPLIAQAVGAGERSRARQLLWQGAWVALAGVVPLGVVVVALAENIGAFGVPAQTAAQVRPYLYARLVGLLPFLILAAARAFLQAHEITRPLVIGVVVANLLNLPLTYLLVFGDAGLVELSLPALGVPSLGTEGAGWASTVATFVQLAVALAAVRALWGSARPVLDRPRRIDILKVLRLGTPIGLQLGAEVGSFALVTVLMGNIGVTALGSHNVALTAISVTFQLPVALGVAAAVRVGHAVGRRDGAGARRAGLTAIGTGALAMGLGAALFLSVPELVARVLTDEAAIIEATVPLLAIAAAFQLSDGVQAVAAGALRGAGDTRWPLIANLVGHYAVGVPLGATLGFALGWGAAGLWWGLSAGLTAVAIALTVRFLVLSRGSIRRA